MRTLQEIGQSLGSRNIFTGGPVEYFEASGRLQLAMMIREGVYPWSKVVDIGCGCLRGGYWMIHFLDPGCYYGIEPNASMIEVGFKEILEPQLVREKHPTVDYNAVFETAVFGVKFDAFFCRSIWTHTSKAQIEGMLDNFLRDSNPNAFFLTSYLRARWPWEDYMGTNHVGRSHVCDVPGLIKHRRAWIEQACHQRGLNVIELPDGVMARQKWLKISRSSLEQPSFLMEGRRAA